ncbi:unnamed protein product [Brachionus calyciflorus]|uniref:Uncharacterized protein n=1 Tax=Brachionus calyciflorus TaxID=104777 RepID=A0A813Z9D7_9BILA|nr:unnamed protein product [Brachionus calyciflorus]
MDDSTLDTIRKERSISLIKKIIINWALNTTAHAFGNIIRAQSIIIRIIWTICLLASTAYCFYLIIQTIVLYTKYEVNTRLNLVYETPTKFPAVTICNLNTFNADFSKESIEDVLNEKRIFANQSKPIDFVETASQQFKAPFNDPGFLQRNRLIYFGFFLREMLGDCKYQRENCFKEDFQLNENYYYGNCFTFNSDTQKTKLWKKTGIVNGLRLELYTGGQEVYTYKTGFKVFVHNQSDTPFFDEEGIDVSVGQQTNIAISRTFLNRLSEPHSNCIQNDNLDYYFKSNSFFKYIWTNFNFTRYTLKYCMKACLQDYIVSQCACFDTRLVLPIQTKLSLCISTEQVECTIKSDIEFHNRKEIISNCYEKCPNECNKVIYHQTVSKSRYPTKWYSDLVNKSQMYLEVVKKSDLSHLEKNALVINVYYDRNYYMSIDESPSMTFEDLLAFIGGNFGLFVGASMLTFGEAIEIFFLIVFVYVSKYFNFNSKKREEVDINDIEMNRF